jgi:hypothetical protein
VQEVLNRRSHLCCEHCQVPCLLALPALLALLVQTSRQHCKCVLMSSAGAASLCCARCQTRTHFTRCTSAKVRTLTRKRGAAWQAPVGLLGEQLLLASHRLSRPQVLGLAAQRLRVGAAQAAAAAPPPPPPPGGKGGGGGRGGRGGRAKRLKAVGGEGNREES